MQHYCPYSQQNKQILSIALSSTCSDNKLVDTEHTLFSMYVLLKVKGIIGGLYVGDKILSAMRYHKEYVFFHLL